MNRSTFDYLGDLDPIIERIMSNFEPASWYEDIKITCECLKSDIHIYF